MPDKLFTPMKIPSLFFSCQTVNIIELTNIKNVVYINRMVVDFCCSFSTNYNMIFGGQLPQNLMCHLLICHFLLLLKTNKTFSSVLWLELGPNFMICKCWKNNNPNMVVDKMYKFQVCYISNEPVIIKKTTSDCTLFY